MCESCDGFCFVRLFIQYAYHQLAAGEMHEDHITWSWYSVYDNVLLIFIEPISAAVCRDMG